MTASRPITYNGGANPATILRTISSPCVPCATEGSDGVATRSEILCRGPYCVDSVDTCEYTVYYSEGVVVYEDTDGQVGQ